jgi:hypothetical protein
MRSQLRDHADICGSLVMAPPVEKLLRNKEETNPEKLFTQPISKIHSGLHVSKNIAGIIQGEAFRRYGDKSKLFC